MKRPLLIALCLPALLGACSSMKRSSGSGYEDNPAAAPLAHVEDRPRLRALESRLESSREKEQYSKVLPWFENDAEKIEFLSIPTMEGRQKWVNDNQIWRRAQNKQENLREVVQAGDISVGMPMELVKKAWGEPQSVEVSGNPVYKNERWKYMRYISSQDGYKQERRHVYFEGGRVVGWDTE